MASNASEPGAHWQTYYTRMHMTVMETWHAMLWDTAWSMTVSKTWHGRWWATIRTVTSWWRRGRIKRAVRRHLHSDSHCLPVSSSPPPPCCTRQRICWSLGVCTVLAVALSDVSVVLSVELTRCCDLLLACWYLQISGTIEAARPVLKWHARVAEVRVFERYDLVAYTKSWHRCQQKIITMQKTVSE